MSTILSVVIPARNEFPNVTHTFHSIMNCWEADGFDWRDIEIIIVDNCSDDDVYPQRGTKGTTSYLEGRGGYFNRVVRVVRDPIAGNHSARNVGAKHALGKYLYFSDAHMSLRPGFFKSILKAVDESGGLVHGALQFMGAYPPTSSGMGWGYTIKLGEEIKGCVDEQTELLTNQGWKKWSEVDDQSIQFVTFNMKTRHLEFQKSREIVLRDHNGPMIKMLGRSMDALLTPYHRVPYIRDFTKECRSMGSKNTSFDEMSICQAEDAKSNYHYPIGSKGLTNNISPIYSDDLVRLIGWIITEGCINKKDEYNNPTIIITQYIEENREEIENLLKRLGFSYCVKGEKQDFKIHQNDTKKILEILPNKELTLDFIKKLTIPQMHILKETMIDGDGTRSKTNVSFIQTNKTTIDNFQILCTLLGYATTLYVKKAEVFKGNHYGLKDVYVVSIKSRNFTSNFEITKENYKGKVWCPDLENGTVIARRNGRTYITGNTWNNYLIGDGKKWFYVPAQGHWGVAVLRQQFLDFGGYPKVHRCYGGGEFYLDMKWWLFGSTVCVDPGAIGYHLASGRGYSYNHDDYVHNVFNIGLALGMDDWVERTYINYCKKGRKEVLDRMMEEAHKETVDDRKFIEARRICTFNQLIVDRPWEKKNKEKHGSGLTAMLIYHKTWINGLKGTPAESLYPGKYQEELAKFIETDLKGLIYKPEIV